MSNTNQGDHNINVQALSGCPYCGGNIEGDGYTIVLHCENADLPLDVEPDAEPVLCEHQGVEAWM